MKKFVFSALCTLFILPLFGSQYIGINGGSDYCYYTDSSKGQKVGFKLGANYGYRFENGIRAEAEIAYRDGSKRTKYVDPGEQKTHASGHSMSYMANVLYDVPKLSFYEVTPYFGAGIGICQNTTELKIQGAGFTSREKEKDDRFAYQAIVGGKYPLSTGVELGLQYNYHVGRSHAKNHGFGLNLIRQF